MKKRIFVITVLLCLLLAGSCANNAAAETTNRNTTVPFTVLPTTGSPANNETSTAIPSINVTSTPETVITTNPPDPGQAKTGTASDIQAAVNAVSSIGGGTVYIPEGEFSFDGHVSIGSNIKLVGAGIDKTILHTRGPSMIIQASGEDIRISGFSLISDSLGGNGIVIEDAVNFRVDHLRIDGYSDQAAVFVSGGNTRGVVDHCDIKMGPVSNLGYGVVVYGDDTWKDGLQLGTPDAVFIEDNSFNGTRHAVAANKGAHYVFRYNTVVQDAPEQAIDAHGPYWGSDSGTQAVEIYHNKITGTAVNGSERAIGIRGGSGVIFNNDIKGYTYGVMLIIEDKQDLSSYPVYHQVHDLYIWNNTYDGDSEVIVQRENRATKYIDENRDFFLSPKDGYKPYTYPHPLTLE